MSRGVYVVGERIKARRALLGMNQKLLAELVGVKQAHISKIESGGSVPSEQLYIKIAQTLKTTPEYLSGITDEPNMLIPDNLKVFDRSVQKFRIRVVGRISAGGPDYCSIVFEDYMGVIETERIVDVALQVRGDSMEPRLYDGDIVLVQKTPMEELKNADIIVIIINGEEGLVKRVFFEPKEGVVLKSDNAHYPPRFIPFSRFGGDCFIVGKVIEIRSYPK